MLDGESLRENILSMLEALVGANVAEALGSAGGECTAEGLELLSAKMDGIYFAKGALMGRSSELVGKSSQDLTAAVYDMALHTYEAKEALYGADFMRELERVIMLRVVDEYWMDNIDAMDDLKQGIYLRAYGQHDPVIAYKEEGYEMFEAMIQAIKDETVRRMFLVQVRPQQEVKRVKVAKETGTGDKSMVKKQPVRNKGKKVAPTTPAPAEAERNTRTAAVRRTLPPDWIGKPFGETL